MERVPDSAALYTQKRAIAPFPETSLPRKRGGEARTPPCLGTAAAPRAAVLLLRLVRLVVVVVCYECIMNVFIAYWLGSPPWGTRRLKGARAPRHDTGWALVLPARTPSTTTHARQVRTQLCFSGRARASVVMLYKG